MHLLFLLMVAAAAGSKTDGVALVALTAVGGCVFVVLDGNGRQGW